MSESFNLRGLDAGETFVKRYGLRLAALLCGVLLAFAFPLANVAGFAWLAPGGLLLIGLRQPGRKAFQNGYLFGLSFCLTTLYWLLYMPVKGFPIAGWIALSGYLALFYAVWLWLCARSLPGTLDELVDGPWLKRTVWILGVAGAWIVSEWLMSNLLTGFPWIQIGVTQHRMIPLIQVAATVGVPGLSFLIVWFSVSFMFALLGLAREPRRRHLVWREVCLPLFVIALVFASGSSRVRKVDERIAANSQGLKLALIQPSFSQTELWDPSTSTNRFDRLIELTEEALTAKPHVLIWPEAGMPGYLRYEENLHARVTGLAREHGVWIICGGDDVRFRKDAPEGGRPDFFNSMYLISPQGEVVAQYDKRSLVMFGEYVPLSKWLPFLKWFTPIGGGYTPGKQAVSFPVKEHGLEIGSSICFEDVFSWVARDAVTPKTHLLVNLTNDGWFSDSAEQWQHLANALFRAVETGRPLVRCCNNGITCWVDPVGRVHSVGFTDDRSVYAEGYKVFEMTIPKDRIETSYWRSGDWFVLVGLALAVWMIRMGRVGGAVSVSTVEEQAVADSREKKN